MSDVLDRLFDGAEERRLDAGQALFLAEDPVVQVWRVRAGAVALIRRAADGAALVLQRAGPGEVVAEASVWSERYHCGAEALAAARVAAIPRARFRARLAADPALAEGWARSLAQAVRAARARAGLLALGTVSARLDAWLAEGNALPARGHLQDVAAEIGVSREALYRELSRRRPPRGKG